MKVGYVCTNYNNSAFTIAAIESLIRAGAGHEVAVVVVDNKSNDADTVALRRLERDMPNVHVILSETNLGYFPGLNIGIRAIRRQRPEMNHLVVGNNDLLFPEDFVAGLERGAAVLDRWAVVAPDLVTPQGVHQNPHVRYPISRVRRLVWDLYYLAYPLAMIIAGAAALTKGLTAREENTVDGQLYRNAGPIEQGYGACYLLGPKFFEHFGGFFAPTFMMHEEFFLFEQLKTIGQLTYYEPRFVVQHHGHATTRTVADRRRWVLGHDAHNIYKRYLAMTAAEQRRWIETSEARRA